MKIFVIKAKQILVGAFIAVVCLLLSLDMFSGSSAAAVFSQGATTRKVPIYAVDTKKPQVAISFDAAWGADKTQSILDTLKDFNMRATFFLVGFWAEDYPDMVKKIDEAGMEIGLHSNTHPDMSKLSEAQIKQELETNISILENILGYRPTLFRPPFGAYNDRLLTVCEQMGITVVQWSVDSLDWKDLSAIDITNRILNRTKKGSIILCHNNAKHIANALPVVLDRLLKKGYTVGAVGDLLMKENYLIDKQGIQRKK